MRPAFLAGPILGPGCTRHSSGRDAPTTRFPARGLHPAEIRPTTPPPIADIPRRVLVQTLLDGCRLRFAVFQRAEAARTAAQISGAVRGLPDNFPILN